MQKVEPRPVLLALPGREGKVGFKLPLLGSGQGGEVFSLKAAQQERPTDHVAVNCGIGAVGRQIQMLPLTVADEHHPLGQVTPSLDGSAHDLLK